jgi:Tfp pilus assembly protein PilN
VTWSPPNLAGRPFVNLRPLARAAAALWTLGGLLLLFNLVAYWGHIRGTRDLRGRLARAQTALAGEDAAIARLADELRRRDLARQNVQVAFLNRRIAERTFGWSALFERLSEVLPRDVRIYRLAPVNILPARERRGAAAAPPTRKAAFTLDIAGAARTDEALLELIDALFAHPAFAAPKLSREARDGGEISFDLSVTYEPRLAAAPATGGEPPAPPAASPPEEPE